MSLSTKNSPERKTMRGEIMAAVFRSALFMLNQDGTLQLDGHPENATPTYDQK